MYLDIIVSAIFLLFIIIGIKKGFIRAFFKTFSLIASIIAAAVLYIPFSNFIYATPIPERVQGFIENNVTSNLAGSVQASVSLPEQTPSFLQEAFIKQSGSLLNKSAAAATEMLTGTIVNILCIVLIFIAANVVLAIIGSLLDGIFKLPVLNFANRVLGGVLGLLNGLLIVYIACAVMTFMLGTASGDWIAAQIATSKIARYFYDNNLILSIII